MGENVICKKNRYQYNEEFSVETFALDIIVFCESCKIKISTFDDVDDILEFIKSICMELVNFLFYLDNQDKDKYDIDYGNNIVNKLIEEINDLTVLDNINEIKENITHILDCYLEKYSGLYYLLLMNKNQMDEALSNSKVNFI